MGTWETQIFKERVTTVGLLTLESKSIWRGLIIVYKIMNSIEKKASVPLKYAELDCLRDSVLAWIVRHLGQYPCYLLCAFFSLSCLSCS